MARPRTLFACTHCGARQPRWLGRCPDCGEWNTLVEERAGPPPEADPRPALLPADGDGGLRALGEVEPGSAPRLATGLGEVDRVLGGGLVPGSVVLLAGEPGVGKSTLALQIAAAVLRRHGSVLYVCGEESPEQIRLRADRLPDLPKELLLLSETSVERIAGPWRERRPALVLVDSVQTVHCGRVESAPGSVAQVRESAALLAAAARSAGAALVLIGHVTKEGSIAGPRVLEHLVDVVLTLEGERAHPFRMLRAAKNRFGSTAEVGVFQMGGAGLQAVANPSELFLAERRPGAPGSTVAPLVEGTRPILVEIQALLAPTGYGTARRTAIGVDDARLALLLAVLDRRARVDLLSCDVYVNATGGVRVFEPAADLAIALAIVSSRLDLAVPPDVAACGEVGLGGEVRRVGRLDLRLAEAARLGFRRVLVPETVATEVAAPAGVTPVPVRDVADAVAWLRDQAAPRA